jgi:hypothetical protein
MQLPTESWAGLAAPLGPHNLDFQVRTRGQWCSHFPFLSPIQLPGLPPFHGPRSNSPRFTAPSPWWNDTEGADPHDNLFALAAYRICVEPDNRLSLIPFVSKSARSPAGKGSRTRLFLFVCRPPLLSAASLPLFEAHTNTFCYHCWSVRPILLPWTPLSYLPNGNGHAMLLRPQLYLGQD